MHIFKCVSSFFMLHGLRPFLGVVISATSTRFFLCTTRSCGWRTRPPTIPSKVHHVDGSNRVVAFCGDVFFLRSSIRCFLSSFLCSRRRRRSSKRASPVSCDNRDDGVSIPLVLFARSRTPSCSTFIFFFLFVSFVSSLCPSFVRSSFLFWTKFNAKSVVVFKDTLLFCDDDILGDDIRFRRFRWYFLRERVCVFVYFRRVSQNTNTRSTINRQQTTLFLVRDFWRLSCIFKTDIFRCFYDNNNNNNNRILYLDERASKIRTYVGRGHVSRERRRRKKRNNNVFSFSFFVFFFFSARRGASILAGSQFPRLPAKRRRMCSLSHACVFCNHSLSYFFFTSQRVIKDAHI